MVCRHRFLARGFYDLEINKHVESTSFEKAAEGLDLRHRMACDWGVTDKPIISKKTLDDYQHHFYQAHEKGFNFEENKAEKIS